MFFIVISVVPLTTDLLMVGIFGPITCSGYTWLAEMLQYTVYAVIFPFVTEGTDHMAES